MTSIFRNTIVTVIGHRNINSFKAFTLKTMVIICYISMLVYISLSFECKSSGAIEITILWSYELQSQTRWRPQWWTCTTSSWVMWTASAKASNHVSLHSFYFGMFHRRDQKTQSLTTIKVGIVFTVWLWNNAQKYLMVMFQLLHLHVDNWFELITLCEIATLEKSARWNVPGKYLCVWL